MQKTKSIDLQITDRESIEGIIRLNSLYNSQHDIEEFTMRLYSLMDLFRVSLVDVRITENEDYDT
jgi:hypothetical protein